MRGNPIKKAYRQQARQTRKTARATARDTRAVGNTMARGAKMMGRAESLSGRMQKKSSAEVSRMRKGGQVGRGPSKKLRYRAMDAEVKKSTGADMMANPRKYMSGAKVNRGAKRSAPVSGLKSGQTKVNRRGNPAGKKTPTYSLGRTMRKIY